MPRRVHKNKQKREMLDWTQKVNRCKRINTNLSCRYSTQEKKEWPWLEFYKRLQLQLPLVGRLTSEQHTFRRGLSLVSIMKSYLQSSQQRVSELLIHWCRQAWWTNRRVPVQRHGVMRGLSSSPSQWQILTGKTATASQPQQSLFALPFGLRANMQSSQMAATLWISPQKWTPFYSLSLSERVCHFQICITNNMSFPSKSKRYQILLLLPSCSLNIVKF